MQDYSVKDVLAGAVYQQDELEAEALAYLREPSRTESEYSAEIASLRQIGLDKQDDKVILLFSDTPDGAFCAWVNAKFIQSEKPAVLNLEKNVIRIPGLNTENAEDFVNIGLRRLITTIEKLVDDYKGYQIYLNFTGGYKGIIPALTDVAIRKVLPLYYLFEPDEELKHPELIKILFQSGKLKYYLESKQDYIVQVGQERINDERV
ncbi:MAG: hypothetical protein ACE5G1_15080 [bacterium]